RRRAVARAAVDRIVAADRAARAAAVNATLTLGRVERAVGAVTRDADVDRAKAELRPVAHSADQARLALRVRVAVALALRAAVGRVVAVVALAVGRAGLALAQPADLLQRVAVVTGAGVRARRGAAAGEHNGGHGTYES